MQGGQRTGHCEAIGKASLGLMACRAGNTPGAQARLEKELMPETRCLEIVGQGVGQVGWRWWYGTESSGSGPFSVSPQRSRSRLPGGHGCLGLAVCRREPTHGQYDHTGHGKSAESHAHSPPTVAAK
jgi:hypothetical protein